MRILGIDLGTSSIKAVELDSAFGRVEIHDYYDHKIEQGESQVLAIQRLMQALPRKPDRIAMTIPTRHLTFRNLKLPTRDRKAILAGVGFELEDELPFPIEKAVYDYSVISQSKQTSEVHVAATLRKQLTETVENWKTAGIDPDIITSESWAYRAFLNRVLPASEQIEPVLIVDIGDARTVFYVHWHGSPIFAREIRWGGRDLTEAISKKYGLAWDQSETAKLDHGFIVPESQKKDVTTEQVEFSKILMEPVDRLLQELRQIEFSCKSLTHHKLNRIYISGGTTLLPGLARSIEERIHVSARPLQSLSAIASSGVTYSEQSDADFLLAASAALCLVGSDRASVINFRKGEFARKGQSRELNLASLRRPLISGAAIVASLFVSLMVESSIYRTRLKDADSQLERSLRSFFGSVSAGAVRTYLSDTSKLRSNIDKELNKQRELGKLAGPHPKTPLEFLRTVSSAIPKDVVVDLTQFQVGAAPTAAYSSTADQSMSLTFLVANPQTAEKLSELLNPKVSGLQRGKMEEVTSSDGAKRWRVTYTGKPSEDSYAK